MQFEKWYDIDLMKPRHFVPDLGFPTFEGDNNSVRIGVNVYSDRAEKTVTGTIKGYVILPNGVALLPFDGAKDGNKAWIDLPDDALVMEGRIKVSVRCFDGDETTVLFQASATVCRVDSTAHYDPDDEVGDITDLIEEAERISGVAEQAAEDAQAALAQATNIVSTQPQTLTPEAQAQARANIGAASEDDMTDLRGAITEKTYNLVEGKIANALVSSIGKIEWNADYDVYYAPVEQGVEYTVNANAGLICGFFENAPSVGSVSYNGERIIQALTTITSPVTGYIAFRVGKDFQYAQVVIGSVNKAYVPPITAKDIVARDLLSSIENDVESVANDVESVANDGAVVIEKTIEWQNGFVSNIGKVTASTLSRYAVVQMHAGETVKIGTANSNITIIGSTTADTVNIGDSVTVIQKTTSSGNFETYTYTAETDIKIVLCVNFSDYICHFTKKAPVFAKVTEETNSLGRILYKGFELIENEWEKGGLEQGKNDSYRNACRIRLKNIVYTPIDITFFTKASNTAFWVAMYDMGGIYTGSSAKQTAEYTIPSGTYFRMFVDGSDNTTAQTQSVSDILAKIYKTDKNINDVCSLSQTPNITFMCRDGRVTPNLPPNSKYAIMATAENQYDMIRFSVTKTTDGEYVAVHDVTINNLAVNMDGTAIGTTIRTDECSLAQLNQYDWGLKFGNEYAGLRVPMLEDCLALASMYNLRVALDFKWGDFTSEEVDTIVAMLAKYGQYNAFIIVSYNVNKSLFASKNKRFSQGFIGHIDTVINSAEFINSLLSTRNNVYLWTTPSDPPTTELINYAMAHDLDIICSEIEGLESLISFGFDKGVTLMECHYIENIKTTVRDYANSTVQ